MHQTRIPIPENILPDIDIPAAEHSFGLAINNYPENGLDEIQIPFHYHENVELNFVERGSVTYIHCNRVHEIPEGKLGVFWAGYPHKIFSGDENLSMWWITVPLEHFIGWKCSRRFLRRLMQGEIITENENDPDLDLAQIRRWAVDLREPQRRPVLLLELEARLKRLELRMCPRASIPLNAGAPNVEALHPATLQIASYILENFQQPLSLEEISKHVKLNPSYVNRLFKKHFGQPPGHFLREVRISHAINLLQNSDAKVLDVAYDSGFQSSSRFYAAFRAVTGKQPKEYRKVNTF